MQKRRDEMMGSLVASYHAYEDLLEKTTKGQFHQLKVGKVSFNNYWLQRSVSAINSLERSVSVVKIWKGQCQQLKASKVNFSI